VLAEHLCRRRRCIFAIAVFDACPGPFASAKARAIMPAPDNPWRIAHIALDQDTILWRNADVEQERRVAIYDLIEENTFKPLRAVERGHEGPWRLNLAVQDGRLALDIRDMADAPVETIVLGLARFRRPIREYFAICDSYYQAIRKATPAEIETIDMARRGIHNNAAELLLERLDGKVETDFPTARRLFTLICVLHIKG
jgi:uncharacterized protein (UPF0262 family)